MTILDSAFIAFYRRLGRTGATELNLKATTSLARGIHIDTLEPRILLSADLIPVAGTIDVPGETDFFSFELAESRQLIFDALTPSPQITWALSGEGGAIVSPTTFNQSDGAQGGEIIALDAGTYTLTVDGQGDQTGDYSFRLLNASNAQNLTPGTRVDGSLANGGRETSLYQFDAEVGTDLVFNAQAQSGGTAYWELIDPDGETVFGPVNFAPGSNLDRFTTQKAGTYTLLFEGYLGNSTDLDYGFTLNQVVDRTSPMTLDTPVFGTFDQPAQQHFYDFTLTEDTRVFIDVLRTTERVDVTLTGPTGKVIDDTAMWYLDRTYDPIRDLVAGDYRLAIVNRGSDQTQYGIQLLTEASAEALTLGTALSDRLDDQGPEAAFRRVASTAPIAATAQDRALEFNNRPIDQVAVPDSAELRGETFTIETWLRPDDIDTFDVVALKTSSQAWNDGWGLYLEDDGSLVFFVNQWNDEAKRVRAPLTEGAWQHVAASYDGVGLKLYVDGVLAAEKAMGEGVNQSTASIAIGGQTNQTYNLDGALDELRLWSEAQSAAEIAARYRQEIASPTAELAMRLGFDEASGSRAVDSSGNGNDGLLGAGPGTETRIFKFDGSADQVVSFSAQSAGNAYLRILNPDGTLLRGPTYLSSIAFDPLELPQTGSYLVLVEGFYNDNVARPFTLLVAPESIETLSLDVGDSVTGRVDEPGLVLAYDLNLTETTPLYFDAITAGNDFRWWIVGPHGEEVAPRAFGQSNANRVGGSAVYTLGAGDYKLMVDAVGGTVGDFAFNLFDIRAGQSIALDSEVTFDLAPGSETEIFRIDLQEGDEISFERTLGNPYIRVLGPRGDLVFGDNYMSNFGNQVVARTGTYTVLVEGFDGQADASFAFSVQKHSHTPPPALSGTALTLGDTVSGAIGLAGEVDRYLFTLANAGEVYFDALGWSESTTQFTLRDASGTIENRTFVAADATRLPPGEAAVFALAAGTYEVAISKAATATGAYSFRMLDIGAAAAIEVETPFTGTLAPRSETIAYRFEAEANQQMVLDLEALSGRARSIYARIIGPDGREILRDGNIETNPSFMSRAAGQYLLLIEGDPFDQTGEANFTLNLLEVTETTQPITLNTVVSNDLATRDFVDNYTLEITEETLVVFDQQTRLQGGSLRIVGANLDRTFSLDVSNGAQGADVVRLRPGSYQLTARTSQHAGGSYAFRLMDASDAAEITVDTAVAATLTSPGTETDLYRIALSAGQRLTLQDVTNTGGTYNAYLRLLDPFGVPVDGSSLLSAGKVFEAPIDGTYLVMLEAHPYEDPAKTISYGFTLGDPQDPSSATLTLDEMTQGTIGLSGQVHQYDFTLGEATLLWLDSFTDDSRTTVEITGPGGVSRSYNLRSADAGNYGGGAIRAAAGVYSVRVYRSDSGTGAYAFKLLDLAEGTEIAFDELVAGQLEPRRETDVYRLDGAAGDSFLFDLQRNGTLSYTPTWKLIDPLGNVEISQRSLGDQDLFELQRTGVYTLLVEGYVYEPETGAVDYSFVLQQPSRVEKAVDLAATNSGYHPATGPDGGVAQGSSGFQYVAVDGAATNLVGDVSFEIQFRPDRPRTTWQSLVNKSDGNGVGGRQYSLWLNSSGYLHLTSSDSSGQIAADSPSNSVAWGEWNSAIGVVDRTEDLLRLYLNGAEVGSIALRPDRDSVEVVNDLLIGATREGNAIFEGAIAGFRLWDTALTAADATTLSEGGSIATAALIDLPMNEAPGAVRFADQSGNDLDATVIDTAGGLKGAFRGHFDKAGELHVYSFTLDDATQLYWDNLNDRTDVDVTLTGPDGLRITRSLRESGNTSYGGNYVFDAPAGQYTLSFEAENAAVGAHGLALLDLADAVAVSTDGTVVDDRFEPDRTARLYRFDAVEGQEVYVDVSAQSLSTSQMSWRLIDPFGRQIYGPENAGDIPVQTLAFAGQYTLILESDPDLSAVGSGSYKFSVTTVNTTPVAVSVGGDNPGLAAGAPVAGRIGDAIDLRGAEYLEVPNNNATNLTGSMTIEAWVKPDRYNDTWTPLLQKSDGEGGRQYALYLNANGSLHFSTTRAGTDSYSTLQSDRDLVPVGEWSHVAAVVDRSAGRMRIYVNGEEVGAGTLTAGSISGIDTPLWIGRGIESSTDRGLFEGAVDEVRLWRTAHTQAELSASYQGALTGTEADLALYLPLDTLEAGVSPAVVGGDAAQFVSQIPQGITGSIVNAGERRVYTFGLTETTLLTIDSLSQRSDMRLSLTGPAGTYLNRRLDQTDGPDNQAAILSLPPGEYQITVTAEDGATGDFNFELLDLADATPLTLGTTISGELAPSSRTVAYRFTGAADQTLFMDAQTRDGDIYWRLVDPFGATVFNSTSLSDRDSQRLDLDGIYTLLIEGRVYSAGTSRYQFTLTDTTTPPETALTLGALTTADITQPGERLAYTFEITDPTVLIFDPLISSSAARWSLHGDQGVVQADRAFSQSDSVRNTADTGLRVAAGQYRLYIDWTGDQTGEIPFRLHDLKAQASEVFVNDRIVGNLPSDSRGSKAFFVDMARLQRFDMITAQSPSSGTYWRIFDADGYQIEAPQRLSSSGQGFIAPEAGRYYLLLEGDSNADSNLAYDFELESPLRADAIGKTIQTFDAADGIPFISTDKDGNDLGTIAQGSNALKMLDALEPGGQSQVEFDLTREGPLDLFEIGFDFDFAGPGGVTAGEGFSVIAADAALFGRSGDLPYLGVEPNHNGVIAAALDLVQGSGDGVVPHVSLHAGGTEIVEVDLADFGITVAQLEAAAGHITLSLARTATGLAATVTLSLDGAQTKVIDAMPLVGQTLSDLRGAIHAQSLSTNTMDLTIDNVRITATPAAAPLTITPGTEFGGDISVAGQVQTWQLTLAAPTSLIFDARAANGQMRWSLSGPKNISALRFSQTDAAQRSGNTIYDLPAGTYEFNVSTVDDSLGSYAFALLDLASATELTLGTTTEGTISPSNVTQLRYFDLSEPTEVFVQTDSVAGGIRASWRIIREDGVVVSNPLNVATDRELGVLAGLRHYVLFEGYYDTPTEITYSFTAHPTTQIVAAEPLALNTEISATITAPLQELVYEFDLAAPTHLVFDSLTDDPDMSYRLVGPAGTIDTDKLNSADYNETTVMVRAPAGSYQLILYGNQIATGDVRFALRDVAGATEFVPGETVVATFEDNRRSHIFKFEGSKGEAFYLDSIPDTFNGNWKILNAYGGQVMANGNARSDTAVVTLNADGAQYLILDGSIRTGGESEHSFRLVPLEATETAVVLNTPTVGSIELPGEKKSYSFNLSDPTKLYVDALSPNDSRFVWTLSGPRGQVSSRNFASTDSDHVNETSFYELVAGDYTFTVATSGGETGTFSFDLIDAAQAEALTLGTPISDTLAPGSETKIYSFDATAGDRFYFDMVSGNFRQHLRLIDPYGREVFETDARNDVDTITIADTGTYYLLMEGQINSTEDAVFSFNVYANPISAPVILAGIEGQPTPDLVFDAVALTTTCLLYTSDAADE